VTHISPLIGAVIPIITFILSRYFLNEQLSFNQIWAVVLLVLGAFIISFEITRKRKGWHIGMLYAVIAAVFFSLSYVLARAAYLQDTFETGFVIARLGGFVIALPALFVAKFRREIFFKETTARTAAKSGFFILTINKVLAALYFVGINYAISLTSATLVNALSGLQYAVLFVLVYLFTKVKPRFFNEYFTKREIWQEIIGIVLIIIGLGVLI